MIEQNDVISFLNEYLANYDRIILVVDGTGAFSDITEQLYAYLDSHEVNETLIILSRNAENTCHSKKFKKISAEQENELLDLYGRYEFSDRFCVITDSNQYATILNYVKSGVLEMDEAFDAIFYRGMRNGAAIVSGDALQS